MNRELLKNLSRTTPEEQRLLDGEGLDKDIYTAGDSFLVDSAKMLGAGRLISVRPHTRFVDFPPHTHNYIELIYMCSGSTTHMIGGETPLTLRAGELLFLNQHVSHAIRRAEREDVAVNFMVLPQFFDTALDMIGADNLLGQFLAGSLRRDGGGSSCLHFRVADIAPIQNLVENMVWSVVDPDEDSRRVGRITMGLLFLQLLRHTDRLAFAVQARSGNALVLGALREVEENYREASLSAVAQRAGVSPAYLSRMVREATGKTFKELLLEKRLARAKLLLVTSDLPVRDIMVAVGYENSSYFHRAFRGQMGQSPKDYRRVHQRG